MSQRLETPRGSLAYDAISGTGPGIVFLHGFRSDKNGTKALVLDDWCRRTGRSFIRFDYRGHGESSGQFHDCTLSTWVEDAVAVFDHLTEGPQIVVGSSMGGWIMLHLALQRPDRIHSLVGLAAAPDFTKDIQQSPIFIQQASILEKEGVIHCPCDQGGTPYPITRQLLEDGERLSLLSRHIEIPCPVRLVQGMKDADVPWQKAIQLSQALRSHDVRVTLLKDGDHRLSRPEDTRLLIETLSDLLSLPKCY